MAGESVLVVDDGRESRDFIIDYILKPNQYEPLVARNGLEGLEMARQYRPDLILLDLQMPKMNGMQVLDALNEEGLDIPVILMTFHGNEEIAIEVFRKGVRDYVKKPYTVEEMLWAIERSMAEIRLRKEKDALTERLIAANAELNQRIRELNALYQVGKGVTSLISMWELLPHIVRTAIEVTSSEEGSLYLLQGEELVCRAIKQRDDTTIRSVHEASRNPFAWRAIQTGQPLAMSPAETQPLRQKNPTVPASLLFTPLILGERVIGALGVSNVSPNAPAFRKQDSAMLSALADYAAIAIENATNFAELNKLKEQEITQVITALERFLSPNLVDQILSDPQTGALATMQAEVGILAADLRGHAALVGHLEPDRIAEMINHHFRLVAEVAAKHGGTLDRLSGDGVIIFFNAPQPQKNYVFLAAETALALQQAVEASLQSGGEVLRFGIGLHVGEAVVGLLGVMRALDYSAIGKDVQLARRLQEQARPGQVLITDEMIVRLGKSARANFLGEMAVRGQQALVKVYELLGLG